MCICWDPALCLYGHIHTESGIAAFITTGYCIGVREHNWESVIICSSQYAWKQLFQGGRVSPPLPVEPPGSGMLFDNNITVLNGLNNLTVNQLLWSPWYVIGHWSVMSGCILPSKAWFSTSFTSVQLLACTAAAQTQNEPLCFRMLLGVNNPEEI